MTTVTDQHLLRLHNPRVGARVVGPRCAVRPGIGPGSVFRPCPPSLDLALPPLTGNRPSLGDYLTQGQVGHSVGLRLGGPAAAPVASWRPVTGRTRAG